MRQIKLSSLKLAVLPLALSLSAAVRQAAVLTFNYVEAPGGPVLSGTMDGDLQIDGNTFLVTSLGPLFLDAVPMPDVPFVASADFFTGFNPVAVPTVTLDGSFLDLVACSTGACNVDGIAFAVGDLWAANNLQSVFQRLGAFGDALTDFDPAGWSASVDSSSAAPEPGTLALGLSAGLGLLAWKKRKFAR